MPVFKDLSGERFGRLVVTSYSHKKNGSNWNCLCDCGKSVVVNISGLSRKNKPTRSCGCLAIEVAKSKTAENGNNFRHGHATGGRRSKALSVWSGMIDRCYRGSSSSFQYYGARGIQVCDRWKVFENFLDDMGAPPTGMTIERINTDGDYSPENCKWATREEQANNQRSNRKYLINGQEKTVARIARDCGLHASTLYSRLDRGVSIEQAVCNERMAKINGRG